MPNGHGHHDGHRACEHCGGDLKDCGQSGLWCDTPRCPGSYGGVAPVPKGEPNRYSTLARRTRLAPRSKTNQRQTRAQQTAEYDGAVLLRTVLAEADRPRIDWLAHNCVPVGQRQEQMVREALAAERSGRMQLSACHVVPRDWLTAKWNAGELVVVDGRTLVDVLMDTRNIVLGSRELHDLWDLHALHVPVSAVPAAVSEFERELGIDYVNTYIGRRTGGHLRGI